MIFVSSVEYSRNRMEQTMFLSMGTEILFDPSHYVSKTCLLAECRAQKDEAYRCGEESKQIDCCRYDHDNITSQF